MQIAFDNVTFEKTAIVSARLTDMQELRSLIGGDITITFGERSDTYDDACVSDFALTLAEAVVGYLSSPKAQLCFWSPDFHDRYTIEIAGDAGEQCEIYLSGVLICKGMPLFVILEGIRAFILQVRPLIAERYGHIEYLWDFYFVSVF